MSKMRKEYEFDAYISPRAAYDQGRQAFYDNDFDNPHAEHTIHHKEWWRGWNHSYELNLKEVLWIEGKADEAKDQEHYLRTVGLL